MLLEPEGSYSEARQRRLPAEVAMARQRKDYMIRVRISLQEWETFRRQTKIDRTDPSKKIREWISTYLEGEQEATEPNRWEEIQREADERIGDIMDRFVEELAQKLGLEWEERKRFEAAADAARKEVLGGSRTTSESWLTGGC